jgi:hypothetical protein
MYEACATIGRLPVGIIQSVEANLAQGEPFWTGKEE